MWIEFYHAGQTDFILLSQTQRCHCLNHYNDVTMSAIASQITSLTTVYSIVYSDANQRKHQSSASLAFVRGIHRGPVNSPHKWPVTRKMFPFDDVIMCFCYKKNNPKNRCFRYWKNTGLMIRSPVQTGQVYQHALFNTLRPSHNCRHFADDIFKCIFLNENARISLRLHWSLFLSFKSTIFR